MAKQTERQAPCLSATSARHVQTIQMPAVSTPKVDSIVTAIASMIRTPMEFATRTILVSEIMTCATFAMALEKSTNVAAQTSLLKTATATATNWTPSKSAEVIVLQMQTATAFVTTWTPALAPWMPVAFAMGQGPFMTVVAQITPKGIATAMETKPMPLAHVEEPVKQMQTAMACAMTPTPALGATMPWAYATEAAQPMTTTMTSATIPIPASANMTLWAFAMEIAPLTSTVTTSATMQKSPDAPMRMPATTTKKPPTKMAAVRS